MARGDGGGGARINSWVQAYVSVAKCKFVALWTQRSLCIDSEGHRGLFLFVEPCMEEAVAHRQPPSFAETTERPMVRPCRRWLISVVIGVMAFRG